MALQKTRGLILASTALILLPLIFVMLFSLPAYAYSTYSFKIGSNVWYQASSVFLDLTRTGFRDDMRTWNAYLPEGQRLCYNTETHNLTNYPSADSRNLIYKEPLSDNTILGQNTFWWGYDSNNVCVILESDINVNYNKSWTNGSESGRYDVKSVMLHELGHTTGLDHSSVKTAVMYSSLSLATVKDSLTSDDIAGIRWIY